MKLLSSEETQGRLGIRRPTLYLWVRQGKLKARKAGRGLLFDEVDVMGLLGKAPSVPAWIQGGVLEEAKREVSRRSRTGAGPSFVLEYLGEPGLEHVRARVASVGSSGAIEIPAPGGAEFERWMEALKRGEFVFLSHEESAWRVADVRGETGPAGESYIAVDLARASGATHDEEREGRLKRLADSMSQGLYGHVESWTRDGLHGRDAG